MILGFLAALAATQADPARRWVERLRSDAVEERREAEEELRRIGVGAEPALRRSAAVRDREARAAVARLLGRLDLRRRLTPPLLEGFPDIEDRLLAGGPRAWLELFFEAAGPAHEGLRPEDLAVLASGAVPAVRGPEEARRFCEEVRRRGVRSALPALVLLLGSESEPVRDFAAGTLVGYRAWEAVPALVAALEGRSRESAGRVLLDLRLPEAVPPLVRLVSSPDPGAREAAIRILGATRAREAVGEIAARLADPAPDVRAAAAGALAELAAGEAAFRILPLLEDASELVRSSAVVALAEMGAEEAVPALRARLGDASEEVRAEAARALGRLGARESVRDLLGLLKDAEFDVRESAVLALAELEAKEAAPALVELLKGPDAAGTSVIEALERLRAPETIPPLIALLDQDDGNVRGGAARILGTLGARESAPRLLRLLKDEDADVARSAARSLVRLEVREAAPGIAALLDEPSPSIRKEAIGLLGRLGAREEVPALVPFLSDEELGWDAVRALVLLGAREAVPHILESNRDVHLLNAVAEPELWARWREKAPRLDRTLRGSVERLAASASMPVAAWPEGLDEEIPVCGRDLEAGPGRSSRAGTSLTSFSGITASPPSWTPRACGS